MTPARSTAVPSPPASSTRPSFDARATDLLVRLVAQRDHLLLVGNELRAADVEHMRRRVEGMRNALRIQDGSLVVCNVAAGAPRPDRRTCIICMEPGHNAATHGRARR